MSEQIQLVLMETESLPQGYKALEEMSDLGLEPLEFYPHAHGVRLLFKAPENFGAKLPAKAISIKTSINVLKAMLSQNSSTLKKYLVATETKNLSDLIKIAAEFDKVGAEILEIRALRSNHEKNYALFSLNEKNIASEILKNAEHTIMNSENSALKEFLGFN